MRCDLAPKMVKRCYRDEDVVSIYLTRQYFYGCIVWMGRGALKNLYNESTFSHANM